MSKLNPLVKLPTLIKAVLLYLEYRSLESLEFCQCFDILILSTHKNLALHVDIRRGIIVAHDINILNVMAV